MSILSTFTFEHGSSSKGFCSGESKARFSSAAPPASLEGGRADVGGAYWSLSPLLGKEAMGHLYGLAF